MGKNDPLNDHPDIAWLKLRAKAIRELTPTLTNAQTIELAAREAGFKTYAAFRANLKEQPNDER